MKPNRKGTPITKNPWGQLNAPGTARSGGIVAPKVAKPVRDDTNKANGKSDYTRKLAGLTAQAITTTHASGTNPQPYVNKSK